MKFTVYPQYKQGCPVKHPEKHIGILDMANDKKCVLMLDNGGVLELFDLRLVNIGADGFKLSGKVGMDGNYNRFYYQEWWVIPAAG